MLQSLKKLIFLAVICITSDQLSKGWSTAHLLRVSDEIDTTVYQGSRLAIFESESIYLGFNYVRNHGASWGVFRDFSDEHRLTIFHLVSAVVMTLFVVVILRGSSMVPRERFGLSLMVCGAAGNMIDRALHGYVIDLIELRIYFIPWLQKLPVFNLADVYVVIGLVVFSLSAFRSR